LGGLFSVLVDFGSKIFNPNENMGGKGKAYLFLIVI
jgi:hypothetical protein